MLRLVKSAARLLMPRAYERFRNRYKRDARLTRAIVRRQGLVVGTGPFAGMKYIPDAHGSRLVPKLVGSYELELHDAIAEILADPPSVVVDVGCAEGYYAVGFASALPEATVYAYDIAPGAREMCAKLGALNGIGEKLVIQGRCDCKELESLPLNHAFVICDCEGYELELLRPDKVPSLKHARLLVELHDFSVPGITAELQLRFESTHRMKLIDIQERDPEAYESLSDLSPAMKALALFERETDTTPPQQWAYLVPVWADHDPQ